MLGAAAIWRCPPCPVVGVAELKIILPLSVVLPRKTKKDKVFALNLNIYRNTHHMILSQAKNAWKKIVSDSTPVVLDEKIGAFAGDNTKYHFIYTVFPGSNRKFDLANVLPIVQKFTDDALIELGVISDDSYKIIPAIDYRFGKIDKQNPRIELEIKPLHEKYNNLPF